MGRRAKAKELIRRSLLRGGKGWTQLLKETGLARGALSTNLRKMQKEKEVVFEIKEGQRSKQYKLSDQGLVHATVSAISKGVSGQIAHVLERVGRTNPSGVRGWVKGQKELFLEIEDPGLGKVKLTLHATKPADRA